MFFFYGIRRYGKKNGTSRTGVCESCGKTGTLETYDTAQFFHLYWIPLIPLGHVKIIDACPHCNKCRVISPRKYSSLKQKSEAVLLEKLREAPDDPAVASEALGHWAAYNDNDNFEKLASLYQTRMQGNVQVMKSIALGYYQLGNFPKALEASHRLADSDPEKASLIDAAKARLDVAASQPARETKPAGVPILLPYLVPLLIIISLIGAFAGKGFTAGKYREVWLINGSLQTYTLRIDDERYELGSLTPRRITIPMGTHDVQIENAPIECEPFSFEYNLPFTKRIGDNNLLVLNPDGLAFLVLTHVPYIADGSSRTAEPRYEYVFGKKWHVLDEVDYAFRESPDNIDMPSGQSVTFKSQLSLYKPETYDDLFTTLYEYGDVQDFKPFVDTTLRLQPDYSDAGWMLGVVLGTNDLDSLTLLNKGLATRPVLIEWHRFYQTSMERLKPEYDLVAEYQSLLDAEPDNTALKYLRGRIEPDLDKSIAFFTASEEGQGCGGYGYYAMAYNLMCRLQFDQAFDYACKAKERAGSTSSFDNVHGSSCLATYHYQPLLDSIRKKMARDPDDGELVALEVRYLQLMGQSDESLDAESAYLASTTDWMDADTRKGWENYFGSARCYAGGEIDAYLEKLAAVLPDQAEYQQALHKGNTQRAMEMLLAGNSSDFKAYLILYGAAMHHGQKDVAELALLKAIENVESRPDVKAYLTGTNHPSPGMLTAADILPEEKLLVASTLGYLHPDERTEYFQLAKTCNYSPFFPQLLINSWME